MTRINRFYKYAVLALLCLVGLGLRMFRLGTVPLGGHGDVSWIGINALDWLRGGVWPYYVYELYAPEPVIVYLAGISIKLFGAGFFASRLPTALASLLTIPAGFAAARWLSDNDGTPTMRRTMWIVAVAYAVAFYPVILHTGQRSQVFVFEVMLLAAVFGYAWYSGKWWAFAASAVVLALANYTYIPARLLPLMLVTWAVHAFLTEREVFNDNLLPFIGMGLLSALLVAPQLVTYVQTPEAFFARSSQSAGQLIFQSGLSGSEMFTTLLNKFLAQFRIFLLPWDGAYSEMGRSLMPGVVGIGAAAALISIPFRTWDKVLVWSLIGIVFMSITDVLSGTQIEPHGLRMIGVMPFAFLFGARGLALAWQRVEQQDSKRYGLLVAGIGAAILVGQSLYDFYVYHWRYIPELSQEEGVANRLEASDVFITELVMQHAADGQPILITWDDFTRANIPYLLSDIYPAKRSAVLPGGTLDLPEWEGDVLLVSPADPFRPRHDGLLPQHDDRMWVMLYDGDMILLPPTAQPLQPDNPIDTIEDWQGNTIAALHEVSLRSEDLQTEMTPINANLGNEVSLVGYTVDSTALEPGGELWITLWWQAVDGASEDYETFVQVLDSSGNAVAQVHRWTLDGAYRTRLWPSDELTPTRFMLDLPEDLQPGPYTVIAGMYRVLANEPLPVVDEAGNPVLPHAIVGRFKVSLPDVPPQLSSPDADITFGGQIDLLGVESENSADTLTLRAEWQAIDRPTADHTLFVHVVDANGEIAAQLDTQPRGGTYPTSIWSAGEIVPDEYNIPLEGLAAGTYRVLIGWYTLPSGERLQTPTGSQDNRIEVYTFTLR